MNRLCIEPLHRIRASEDSLPNPCRPVRMQAAGWSRGQQALSGFAWRKAFRQRPIWRRAVVAGIAAIVLSGAAGAARPWALGMVVIATTLLTQFWQHVDGWRETVRTWLN